MPGLGHHYHLRARDAALEVWQSYVTRQDELGKDKVLLAQEQYLRLDEQVQNSLTGKQNFGTRTSNGTQGGTFQPTSGVHVAERRLRLLMGKPITDHQLLRPSDEPRITEMVFDWDTVVCEAMTRRPELRRQRATWAMLEWMSLTNTSPVRGPPGRKDLGFSVSFFAP